MNQCPQCWTELLITYEIWISVHNAAINLIITYEIWTSVHNVASTEHIITY